MSEVKTWRVTRATNYAGIASQVGMSVRDLMYTGIDPRTEVGEVVAATKGEAIVRAHLTWPRIPVADLGVSPAPARAPTHPTVGTWVLRPRGNAKQPCTTCGKFALEFWRGEIVERVGPGTYRVQWISWLDGSDTNSDIVRAVDLQDWYRFDDADQFTAACRWVLTQHDHKRSLSFANYGEPEPERLNFAGCQ